jgi:hypothetical protein
MSNIDEKQLKDLAKTAIQGTSAVHYPDLLLFIAQEMLGPTLTKVIERFEKKGLVKCENTMMGTVITAKKKKKG